MINTKIDLFEYENIGYHGHKVELIAKIINGEFYFSTREDDWLGTGLYFFEDDIYQAINWCTKARKYTNWSIIKAHLKSNKLLNLDKTIHYEEFEKWAAKLKKRYRSLGGNKQITTKVIFDFLFQLEPYDLVRHTFDVPKCESVKPTFIRRKQVQICVRNLECILSYEEVNLNEY